MGWDWMQSDLGIVGAWLQNRSACIFHFDRMSPGRVIHMELALVRVQAFIGDFGQFQEEFIHRQVVTVNGRCVLLGNRVVAERS